MGNILIVATTSYAGMGPYVSEIVNEMEIEDNVFFLFRDYNDDFFYKNIKKDLHPKSVFVKIPNTHWNAFGDIFRTRNRLFKQIIDICLERDIKLVHFINAPADTTTIKTLKKKGILVVSTIHDFQSHEAKKEWYKMLRHKLMAKKYNSYIEEGHTFITNSKSQEASLKQRYPEKRIFYHPFPSLVTNIVKNGDDVPGELNGLNKPFILFFGRIEEYKGVSLLYQVFSSTPEFKSNYNLVIAGKGTNTDVHNGDNVIFLNRYIKDTEVAYLFRNAKAVVYPYISATQSGVLTLAFYFGTPILASDVPFFKELIEDGKNGTLFRSGDKIMLQKKLAQLLSSDTSDIIHNEKEYYRNHYTRGVQRIALLNIYEQNLT